MSFGLSPWVLLLMSLGFNMLVKFITVREEKLWTPKKIDKIAINALCDCWRYCNNPGGLDSLYLGSRDTTTSAGLSWLVDLSSTKLVEELGFQLYLPISLFNSYFCTLSMGAGIFLSEYAKGRLQLCPAPVWNPIFTTFSGRTLWLFDFRCPISVWIFQSIRYGLNCL